MQLVAKIDAKFPV